MLCFRATQFSLLTLLLLLVSFIPFSFSSREDAEGNNGVVLSWGRTERLLADIMVLAPKRTYRKDPLNDFKMYEGGLNISNRHYLASVANTAAPFFVIAAIWFIVFGLSLTLIYICSCCRRKEPYGYSRIAYALSLIFLILFTIAAAIGCAVLFTGQARFRSSTLNTLDYIVHQADNTSENLRSVSDYLSAAKNINVAQVLLPDELQTDIDNIRGTLDSTARTLSSKTRDNSERIKNIIESVRLALFIVAAAMLVLALLGFVLSFFGMQFLVNLLLFIGWILVTATFILGGVFLLLHNVTGDTCVAMYQWTQHPTEHTALDDILPCVDKASAQESLNKSKEVTLQIVNQINTVISNVSNINFAPNFVPLYYNQSGPLVPSLCNPYYPDLTDRICAPGEVDLGNATEVWSGYVCQVSPQGICVTTGRLNPTMYGQMTAAINVSYGLGRFGPFFVDLADCTFVRQTFSDIDAKYCPGLQRYSERIYVGLVIVAIAVMFSLVLWLIYGRERRHRIHTKEHAPRGVEGFEGDKKN
ncbi:hypothetical protein ACJIZ3_023165 [Penstemon smallii]|uniref:Transmembrane protein n=1 Tax=Penstemon smallii TaxID=265156 RepID=A0ABD3TNE9_9LAMI